MPILKPADAVAVTTDSTQNYHAALNLLASLFFMWGFITVINNILLPHLKSVFELDYTKTTLIESVWFVAYFVASLPAAKLIERVGYKKAIVIGLVIMAGGSILMVPSAMIPSYYLVLTALFIVACGITLLQVAANPYVTVLGAPEKSSARLNLVQAFNSLGTMLAPLFAGYLILGQSSGGTLKADAVLTQAQRYEDAQTVILPYLIVAVILIVLAVLIAKFPLPAIGLATRRTSKEARKSLSLWGHRNLVWGVPAIFIYLIAEIGVANLFINFVSQPNIAAITHEEASRYLAILWGGMMVGRFMGSFLMRKIPAENVLLFFAIGAFFVMMVASLMGGTVAMWALISVGFFHSIMFPTIFALAIKGLGPLTEEGSGLLIMAISGGALVVVQGLLADHFGIQKSFLLTALCEVYVIFYAAWGCRVAHVKADAIVVPSGEQEIAE
jgi:FHS family L-fucose permease-like MFS transporter